MNKTIIKTHTNREVTLEHRFLNDDFCEDAKRYWANKHGYRNTFCINSYFLSQAIHEFIIDKDIDPAPVQKKAKKLIYHKSKT